MTTSILLSGGLALASLPDPEKIRAKAAEVVARPEFQLDSQVNTESLTLWLRILKWFLDILHSFLEFLSQLPSPLWWMVVIGLSAVTITLIVHIIWSFINAISGTPQRRLLSVSEEKGTTAEELEKLAELAQSNQDFMGAIRFLFRASLVRISESEKKVIRRGITNWELLRRYRSSYLFDPLQWFVQTIDSKWYGHDVCLEEDCRASWTQYSRIRGLIERRGHAVSA